MVNTGLDRLLADPAERARLRLGGARVGLLCNPTMVTRDVTPGAFALAASDGIEVTRLFGPEHGVFGEAQDMEGVGDSTDPWTGLPVVSLYGDHEDSLAPARRALEGLDVLLFDIQDVGARYYTYAATLAKAMAACAEADVRVVVLDRPNPIGGDAVEGGVVRDGFESFVGEYPVAVRHGLTVGELAGFFHHELGIGAPADVVPMTGWRRGHWFDETGLPWVMPSPNMPTLDTATVYCGGCLIEGTDMSEARGTTRPFELVGAPWLCAPDYARRLAAYDLPGVTYRPVRFTPTFQKHAGVSCGGVQLHVTDRHRFRSLVTGVALIAAAMELAPDDFAWRTEAYEFRTNRPAIDLLAGNDVLRAQLEGGADLAEIEASWEHERAEFMERRSPHLLY